ncbi:ACT domain-containing protein [Candidatus Poribacteria bacterium]|nr:ACT domain-containing protein [Candidatus Poribacteria bacterium]
MKIKQIAIFLENRSGRLAEVTKLLGDNDINIRALSLADTSDFGILRLIVNEPDKAYNILKQGGFAAAETEVIAIEIPDKPGGIASVLEILNAENINVEYLYASLEKSKENAIVIFRFEELDKVINILQENKVNILREEEVYRL